MSVYLQLISQLASYDDILAVVLSDHFCSLVSNALYSFERHIVLPPLTGLLEQVLEKPSEQLITVVVEILYVYKTKVEMEDLKKLFTPWKHEMYQMVRLVRS